MSENPMSANGYWTTSFNLFHNPATGSRATITQAAGGSGFRHVCTSIVVSMVSDTLAIAPGKFNAVLRDGATGAGTVVLNMAGNLTATIGDNWVFGLSGLYIPGSDNTAMTLEFGAAVANANQCVSLHGYTVKVS